MRIGGAERMTLNLVRGLCRRGIRTDLVLGSAEGELMGHMPQTARVIDLGVKRIRHAIRPFARYLRRERPAAVISRMSHTNLAAITARALSGIETRLVVVEANTLSEEISHGQVSQLRRRMMRWAYRRADVIAGVSAGVASDLQQHLRLAPGAVRTVYNPVVDDDLLRRAAERPDHRWFEKTGGPPNIVAVGRLAVQKDYGTLLEAFALLRREQHARLVILGEGSERGKLEVKLAKLGISDDVSMPGYADNPYALMSRAAVLAQSSRFEGLPNVLIEALGCGCPVVATDCPSGAAEILDHGKYGVLVPVSDPRSLCDALRATLLDPPDRPLLKKRGQSFSIDKAVDEYLRLIGMTISKRREVA